jgi:hypothetical protein
MPADLKHEPVTVQRTFQVQTAPKEDLPVHCVPDLENAGRLFPFPVFPLEFLTGFHDGRLFGNPVAVRRWSRYHEKLESFRGFIEQLV